jgi:ATP-dependent DNA helicase RecQ
MRAGASGIVYCLSRRAVDDLTAWLRGHGIDALPYHAGLPDEERARNQDAFARDEADVIVATVAFGMGIDKSNVRFVVHRDMPRSIEGWYQEIGRAGRDGLPSECVLMYSWADVMAFDRFLGEIADPQLRAGTREGTIALFRLAEGARCRHQALVAHFGETIEACGSSCDRCGKRTLADLLDGAAGARAPRLRRALDGAMDHTAGSTRGSSPPSSLGEHTVALDIDLFERLRRLRREIADAEAVPAYIVFSDAVLRQMAERVPTTEAGLLALSGVGPAKLERYGARFLELLRSQPGRA